MGVCYITFTEIICSKKRFVTERRGKQGYNIRRRAKQEQERQSHNNTRGNAVKCSYCWKSGHTKLECFKQKRDKFNEEKKKKSNKEDKVLINI